MSIDNIQTNYTNLINPLTTKSVIVSASLENGILSSGSTIDCSGIFGAGDLIANIECIDGTTDIVISANGNESEKNGILATIPPRLLIGDGNILFSPIESFGLSAISNNLVSVGYIDYNNSITSKSYNSAGDSYSTTDTTYAFKCVINDDTYTYIGGGILTGSG